MIEVASRREPTVAARIADAIIRLQQADDLATPADVRAVVQKLLDDERDACTAWIQSLRGPDSPPLYLIDRVGNAWVIEGAR